MLTRISIWTLLAFFASTYTYAFAAETKRPPLPTSGDTKKKTTRPDNFRTKKPPKKIAEDVEEKPFELEYARGEYFTVEARAGYWITVLTGNVNISSGDVIGNDIDLVSDLGLEDELGVFNGELTLKVSQRNRFTVGAVNFSHAGQGEVSETFTFNGVTYTEGVATDSSLDIQIVTIGYELDLVRAPRGYFAIRLSVDLFEIQTSIVTASILENKATISAAIPKAGLAARINISDWVSVTGNVSAIEYEENYLVDGAVYLDVNFTPNIGIFAGWRMIRLEINIDDDGGEIEWSGAYLGAMVRF